MNMDFVQRNLINERNNLQLELAKAKLLIAELSEAYMGKKPEKGPHVREQKPKIYVKGKDGNYEPKPIPTQQQNTSPAGPESTNEQAQYISDLENVIISIAEQLGVHPNDLLDEGILGNVVAKVKNVLGIKSPDQRRTAQGLMTTQQLADYHKKQDTEAAQHNSPENRARREAQTAAVERSRKYQAEKASEPRPLKLDHMGRKMTQASSDMAYTAERIGERPDYHL